MISALNVLNRKRCKNSFCEKSCNGEKLEQLKPCLKECTLVLDMENTTVVEDFKSIHFFDVPQWVRDVELVYLTAIVILGVPGNGLIILVQMKNKDKSSTDCLVLTMAGFDFVCSSFNALLQIFQNTRVIWRFIASTFLCKAFLFISYATGASTTLLVAGIAIDRYIKTCKPLNTFYTTKKAKLLCVCISVVSFAFAVPTIPVFYLDVSLECTVEFSVFHILNSWNIFLVSMTMTVFGIVSVSYFNVTVSLRKRHKEQLRMRMIFVKGVSLLTSKMEDRQMRLHNRITPSTICSNAADETTRVPNAKLNRTVTRSHLQHNVCVIPTVKVCDDRVKPIQDSTIFRKCHRRTTMIRSLVNQEQAVNRTTMIMLLISIIYMITHGFNWITLFLNSNSVLSFISRYLSLSIILINSITNPLFFFCMSSKFRANAKKLIRKP